MEDKVYTPNEVALLTHLNGRENPTKKRYKLRPAKNNPSNSQIPRSLEKTLPYFNALKEWRIVPRSIKTLTRWRPDLKRVGVLK